VITLRQSHLNVGDGRVGRLIRDVRPASSELHSAGAPISGSIRSTIPKAPRYFLQQISRLESRTTNAQHRHMETGLELKTREIYKILRVRGSV
jgi:hypothetical protein